MDKVDIRDEPRHQRHPRSIDPFFAANTNVERYTQLITNLIISG
jgi:hypothetical protein